jgi:pantothenate synthetase
VIVLAGRVGATRLLDNVVIAEGVSGDPTARS